MRKINNEKKINLDYIVFIKKLINSKVVVDSNNKEKIKKDYEKEVNLKFSNLKRVDNRNKRKEVLEKRNNYFKENNINEKEYNKVSEKLVLLSSKRKSNYF